MPAKHRGEARPPLPPIHPRPRTLVLFHLPLLPPHILVVPQQPSPHRLRHLLLHQESALGSNLLRLLHLSRHLHPPPVMVCTGSLNLLIMPVSHLRHISSPLNLQCPL